MSFISRVLGLSIKTASVYLLSFINGTWGHLKLITDRFFYTNVIMPLFRIWAHPDVLPILRKQLVAFPPEVMS